MQKDNEILEKMIMLKDREQNDIYQRAQTQGRLDTIICDIKYLGEISFKQDDVECKKDIYLIIEEKDENVIYKYYDEDMQLIAAEYESLEMIVPSKEFKDKDQSYLKELAELDKDGKSLSEIEAKVEQIKKIAEALGVSPEEITDIDMLDLNKEIESEEEYMQEEQDVLNKRETAKLDIRETTSLDQNIKGETLAKKLGISNIELPNGEKLTDGEKLARVSTSSLSEYTDTNSNMEDSFVVIRSNGEAVPLGEDILKPDTRAGKNSTSNELTVNVDGTVDRENNTSSYKIVNGNGREFLKVGHDEVSGKEIKYSQWSDQRGEYVNTELKTDRDTFMNDDVKQYLKEANQGTREATKTLEKAERHEECEQDVTLIDYDTNNDSHVHIDENDYIPNTNMTWRQFANQCGYRGEGSIEKAQEKFEKECVKNEDLSNEEILENVIEEQNKDFRNIQERRR